MESVLDSDSDATTIAYAFVVYGFVDSIGYSGAIGALTLGLTIANSKQFTLPKP